MIQEMQEEALTLFAWYDQYRRNTTQALFAFLTTKGFWKKCLCQLRAPPLPLNHGSGRPGTEGQLSPENLELRSEIAYAAYYVGQVKQKCNGVDHHFKRWRVNINVTPYMIKLDFWPRSPLLKNGFRAPALNQPLLFIDNIPINEELDCQLDVCCVSTIFRCNLRCWYV